MSLFCTQSLRLFRNQDCLGATSLVRHLDLKIYFLSNTKYFSQNKKYIFYPKAVIRNPDLEGFLTK